MKQETREIREIFEEVKTLVCKKYPLENPTLRVVHYPSSTAGSAQYVSQRITMNSNSKNYRKILIHEFCHLIDFKYNKHKGHTKSFWLLCYEFGLTEKDYFYGLTNSMKAAKAELEKSSK